MTDRMNSKTATTGTSPSDPAPRPFLAGITPAQAAEFIAAAGESAYRAKQLYDWGARKWVTDPALMSNLPASLKEKIREYVRQLRLAGAIVAGNDGDAVGKQAGSSQKKLTSQGWRQIFREKGVVLFLFLLYDVIVLQI